METAPAIRAQVNTNNSHIDHIISSGLGRERKPKVYASYNICECCVHGQEQEKRGGRGTTGSTTSSSRRRESVSSTVSSTVSRNERAVSAPPQTTGSPRKQVKFVKRSVSEPSKSSVEEELGILGRLRLAKEVKKDTIGRLRDD